MTLIVSDLSLPFSVSLTFPFSIVIGPITALLPLYFSVPVLIEVLVTPLGISRVKVFALLLEPVNPVFVGIATDVDFASAA
ncbi:hypothetical protein D3C75_1228980 [compost metagenome]